MIRALLAVALASAPLAAAAQAVTPRPEAAPLPLNPAPARPSVAESLPARSPGAAVSIAGFSEAQVRAKFGEPGVARREAGGAMWTYAGESCALFVFFQPQGREGLRVSGASAGPRQRNRPTPDIEACIAASTKG
jgi:hypothetical protein